jgi:probable addiction module antidote protein
MRLRKFEDHLHERLRDPEYAVEYLGAAKEDGLDEFLYALKEIAAAQEGGITRVAEEAGLGRESMYKTLSKRGNPHLKTVESILAAMGMRLCVTRADDQASCGAR